MLHSLKLLSFAQRLQLLAEGRTGLPKFNWPEVDEVVEGILSNVALWIKLQSKWPSLTPDQKAKFSAAVDQKLRSHKVDISNPISKERLTATIDYQKNSSFPNAVAVDKKKGDIRILVNLKQAPLITRYALIHELVHVFDPKSFDTTLDPKRTEKLFSKHWSEMVQEQHAILVEVLTEAKETLLDHLLENGTTRNSNILFLRNLIRYPDDFLEDIPGWRKYKRRLSPNKKFMRKLYKGVHDIISELIADESAVSDE